MPLLVESSRNHSKIELALYVGLLQIYITTSRLNTMKHFDLTSEGSTKILFLT